MAHRRSIIARAKSLYQHQHQHQHQPRLSPSSFSHITSNGNSQICGRFPINRNYSGNISSLLSGNASRLIGSRIPASYGLIFHRNLSNVPSDFEEVRYGGGDSNGVVDAAGDKAAEAAAAANEVAVSMSDLFPPVAGFQHLIDYIHCYTGFEWWASIAATTLVIRLIKLPISIYELNCAWIYVPALYKHKQSSTKKTFSLPTVESPYKYDSIYEYVFVLGWGYSLMFFFAIKNMAENVPSFMTGGTLWFTDLTTPDHSMALPILLASTLWLRMEVFVRLYLQRPAFESNKKFTSLALLSFVSTTGLPSAIHCYLITTNLFSIVFDIVMMNPRAQEMVRVSSKQPSTGKKT